MSGHYFTKAEKANAKALRYGMRVLRTEVWDASKTESMLFGEKIRLMIGRSTSPSSPSLWNARPMTHSCRIWPRCTQRWQRPRNAGASRTVHAIHCYPKYQQFVDNFDTVSNDVKELRSMCDTVAACVEYAKLA
jgi:hypothetical protein